MTTYIEPVEFIRYDNKARHTVAVFRARGAPSTYYYLSKRQCQKRLQARKKGNLPYEDTERALNNWPD
jgi:hypothetical protein